MKVVRGGQRHRPAMRWAVAGVGTAVAVVVGLVLLPHPRTVLVAWPPVVLRPDAPSWSIDLPQVAAGSDGARVVVVDSALTHTASLAPQTAVAMVRLVSAGGGPPVEWTLEQGHETGEWAADRQDLSRRGQASPAPWLWWLEERGGSGRRRQLVLGRRYRACLSSQPSEARRVGPYRLEVVRPAELPAAVTLTLFHLAVGDSCRGLSRG